MISISRRLLMGVRPFRCGPLRRWRHSRRAARHARRLCRVRLGPRHTLTRLRVGGTCLLVGAAVPDAWATRLELVVASCCWRWGSTRCAEPVRASTRTCPSTATAKPTGTSTVTSCAPRRSGGALARPPAPDVSRRASPSAGARARRSRPVPVDAADGGSFWPARLHRAVRARSILGWPPVRGDRGPIARRRPRVARVQGTSKPSWAWPRRLSEFVDLDASA